MVRSSRLAHDGSTLLPGVTDPGVSRIPLSVVRVDPAVPFCPAAVDPMWSRTAVVSSGPGTRSARGNAERRSARSRHSGAGCSQAPRPGSRRRRSGVRTPSTTTTRIRPPTTALIRHPTQVRTGSAPGRGPGAPAVRTGAGPGRRAGDECSALRAASAGRASIPDLSRPTRFPVPAPPAVRRPDLRPQYPRHPSRRRCPGGRHRCGCRSASP